MRSSSFVRAAWRGGRTVIDELRSEPPVTIRPTRTGIALVGSAAGPVGGDASELVVEVGDNASLAVEAIAATMVFPGATGLRSQQDIVICVGESAHLDWIAQPLLSVVGSKHLQRVRIELAATATMNFHEWIMLGRTSEPGGFLQTELRVERAGTIVLQQEQVYDPTAPEFATSAAAGGFRCFQQQLAVGPPAGPAKVVTSTEALEMRMPLASDIELATSVSTPVL